MDIPTQPLVSATWLAQRMDFPNLRILDARYYLPNDPRDANAEYKEKHLPRAIRFDIDEISDHDSTVPNMLPQSAEKFAALVAALGINADQLTVAYDDGSFMGAPRVWWMFRTFGFDRIRVLNGGIPAWVQYGGKLTGQPESYKTVSPWLEAQFRSDRVRDMAQMRNHLLNRDAQIVDTRPQGRYLGSDPEPRPGLPSGRMNGSLNLPFSGLSDANGLMLPADQLVDKLEQAGIDIAHPIVATCGSGMTAPALALALAQLGIEVPIYDGSWSEWASSGQEIVTGPVQDGEAMQ